MNIATSEYYDKLLVNPLCTLFRYMCEIAASEKTVPQCVKSYISEMYGVCAGSDARPQRFWVGGVRSFVGSR